MDHILEGVLASSHPDSFKRELILKITEQGEAQHSVTDVRNVLQLSMNWILHGTTELQVTSCGLLLDIELTSRYLTTCSKSYLFRYKTCFMYINRVCGCTCSCIH